MRKILYLSLLLISIIAQAQRLTSYQTMKAGFPSLGSTDGTEYLDVLKDGISYKILLNNMSIPTMATLFENSQALGILPNGQDMTDEINAAYADSEVKGIMFNGVTGSDIIVNGTVTIPAGKYAVMNGNRFTGSGMIKKGTIVAYPDQQIFGSSVILDSVRAMNGIVYPEWWGAIASDGVDDVVPMQKAADYVCTNNVGAKIYQCGYGQYELSKGLNFYKRNAGNPNEYDQINVWIRGLNVSQTLNIAFETTIYLNSDSSFAINIQEGKGCIIENLGVTSKNSFNYTAAQAFDSSSTYILSNQSGNRYAPHAGIVLDAFGDGVSSTDRYKDFTSYYTNTSNGGSTTCYIKNVSIFNFVAAVVFSPSGSTQNNEGHQIENIWMGNCREGISTTNSQERTLHIKNMNVWAPMKTVVTNNVYGDRIGDIPMIDVANISGAIFQIMDFNASLSQAIGSFSNIYSENSYRIGNCRAFNTTFTNCQFYFYDTREFNQGPPGYIYFNQNGKTRFEGCAFLSFHGLPQRWPWNFIGKMQFVNTRIQNQVGSVSVNNTSSNDHEYDFVDFYAFNGIVQKNNLISTANTFLSSFNNLIPFGTEITTWGGGTGLTFSDGWKSKQVRRSLSPLVKRVPLGTVSVTVSGDSATATVAALAGTTGLAGLCVYAPNLAQVVDGFTYNGGQVMCISSVDGSGNIVFDKVIKGFATGSHVLYIETVTRITDWYMADISGTSVTNVRGPSGAVTLAPGIYYVYGNTAILVTASASGTATLAYNTSGEGGRVIICPFEYEEYGVSQSDPLTNAFFLNGTVFSKGSFYEKRNGTDSAYGYRCVKSGIKGDATFPPEFIEVKIPPAP